MRISDWSSDVCSSDLIAHDPTQRNRQGPDVGTQYRSAIFPATEAQRRIAEAYIAQLDRSGDYSRPLATTVEKLQGFYPAEAYQDRKSVVSGKSWSVRVALGGRRIIKKKKQITK